MNLLQKSQTLRKGRNKEILRKLQSGESLSSFTSQSSWFPPRPVIEKDLEAVQKLYGSDLDKRIKNAESAHRNEGDPSQNDPQPLKLA